MNAHRETRSARHASVARLAALVGRLGWLPVGLALALGTGPVRAGEAGAEAAWALQQSQVLDLLLADTRRALGIAAAPASTAPSATAAVKPPEATPASPVLRLRGLYGTESRYTVLLEVNGEVKTYRPGATLPINGRGAGHEFRLVRVVDRCVVVRQGARGRLHTACYQRPLGGLGLAAPRPAAASPGLPAGLSQPLPLFGEP